MKYISTRGQAAALPFCRVLLSGLAEDGGLSVPQQYPQIDAATLDAWRHLSYPALAFEIMRRYIDDIPADDLRDLIEKTYTAETFGSAEITPLRPLSGGLYLLGLSNGPTLAFKDIAMQFLGNVFEYVLAKEKRGLNIIGATSGDTGSAAEYAMRGKKGVRVFMLSPHNKMSAFQRAQMFALQDENIHNIAVEGLFDDCQDIVKTLQSDTAFKQQYRLGAVNSINWARILAQTVYYFKAYFDAAADNSERISFCVPSGNFGDICAGHIARMMGLPVARLIVATNENDVLDEFFRTGAYRPRPSSAVKITSSPSMDIAKASNLERFVFDLAGRDAGRIRALWDKVASGEGFDLSEKLTAMQETFGFASGKSTHADRVQTIADTYRENGDLIDPHTAAGVFVARRIRLPEEKIVCLETALPAKFAETIQEALGADFAVPRPAAWQNIENAPQKFTVLPNDAGEVRRFICKRID